ncbi:hypothetical protein GALMADRAFT_212038 [Galerina marginata CBS 339.88]|uniref:WW domain-containing protein n=1 Tax=Galerina marginata (strain CBS 339.88) TaxID=685588 RepID=A0A067SUB1_GALM3|nr:hypothetical protein GALMADRAFT_212038 [Galerina marginata CBS 339.88]
MQNAEVINSDNRPLPDGWMQHYEPSKQIWYYVQTSAIPPKVSFTHPADSIVPNRRVSTMNPAVAVEMPRPNPSPTQPPAMQNHRQPSAAQRLYASSKIQTATPMINSSSIQSLSTSPVPPPQTRGPAQFPTPPPPPQQNNPSIYASNAPSMHSLPQMVNRPLPIIPPPDILNGTAIALGPSGSRLSTYSPSASSNFGNSPSSMSANSISPLSPPYGNNHLAPHRTQSMQSSQPMPQAHGHLQHDPRRTQTYAPGQSGFNANTSNSGPRLTPHLVTMARPPTELNLPSIFQPSGPGNLVPSPPSTGPLSPLSLGGGLNSLTTPSPPASSLLFAPPNSLASPTLSLPTSPPLSTSPTISSPGSNSSTITPESFNKQGNGNAAAQNSGGRQAAQAVFKIAGGVFSATTGLSSGIITGIGDLVTNPRITKMMKSAFSKFNTGVAESDLQAVMQGRPNANYQAVINALIRQQQLQQQQLAAQMQMNAVNGMQYQTPPQQSVDYQAMILEIQRLQKVALAQQAEALLAQQQAAAQQQALAHLQANATQQQQQQVQAQAHAQLKYQQAIQEQQLALAQQQQAQQQQAMAQQQATFAQLQQQQYNTLLHQQQAALSAQNPQHHSQQPQQHGQNSYAQAFNHVGHLVHDMTQQQPQQQQSQQPSMADLLNSAYGGNAPTQQQQPSQQQPSQPSMTDLLNSAYGGNAPTQQQPQQPSMTDMINSMLGGNGSGQGQPPAFDPSTLYADPTGGGGGGGGGGGNGIFDTIAQTFANASNGGGVPSQSDTSGFAGFVNGINQGFSNPPVDPSSFTAGFDLGSLGAGIGDSFNSDNNWSQ